MCITAILLWIKQEHGCTWINRDLPAQKVAFLMVVPLILRPDVQFNTSSVVVEQPWHEMGWWHKICQVQGSIKKTGTVKKCLRFGFQWGSMAYFKALCNAYSLWQPRNHTTKWADGTTGGSVRIVLYVTLDHKTSLKSHGYICSNSQKKLYGSKLLIFLLCQKSLGH